MYVDIDDAHVFLKLFILLYTVIVSDNENGMQHAHDNVTVYCDN